MNIPPTNTPPHNNLKIDPSAIAQTCVIAVLIGLTTTVLQLRQDVALFKEQMTHLTLSKEFVMFQATTEQRLTELENKYGK